VFVGIKNIYSAELAHRDHQAVGGLRSGKLVDIRLNLLQVAAEIDRLPKEHSRHARIRIGGANLVGFRARKTRDTKRSAEAQPLIDLGIDPQLATFPRPNAQEEIEVPRLSPGIRNETLWTSIGSMERKGVLAEKRRLSVNTEIIQIQSGRSFGEDIAF